MTKEITGRLHLPVLNTDTESICFKLQDIETIEIVSIERAIYLYDKLKPTTDITVGLLKLKHCSFVISYQDASQLITWLLECNDSSSNERLSMSSTQKDYVDLLLDSMQKREEMLQEKEKAMAEAQAFFNPVRQRTYSSGTSIETIPE